MVVETNLAVEPPLRRFRGTYIRPLVPSDYEQLYVAEFIHLHSSWRSRCNGTYVWVRRAGV